MKRFFSALILCCFLLIAGLFVFLPYTQAETNPIIQLLNLPAPAPPNPLVKRRNNTNSAQRYDKAKPPKDDASIEELMNYWSGQNGSPYNSNWLSYTPEPSEKAVQRIMEEIEKNPELIQNYLNVLPETPELVEKVKGYYDSGFKPGTEETDQSGYQRRSLKTWLTTHSKYFSDDLLKAASQVREDDDYVTNHKDLLTLVHADWEKARPIVERLYNDSSQPVSQTLARWAYYRHAVETKDSGETEKYRDELKKTVEDKSAGNGKRDLAMDALVKEGDWSGRDDWYFSLLEDETLYNLIVKGRSFTGLTTIIDMSPPDKYKDKMIELTRSGSFAVRSAAARNLTKILNANNPEVVTALLPWLENPKWAKDAGGGRSSLVRALIDLQMPESVPGLLVVLNENLERPAMTNANINLPANIGLNYGAGGLTDRSLVIRALGTQQDSRAAAPIRQILPRLSEEERSAAVRALFACGGFSTDEQVDALETMAKNLAKLPADENGLGALTANSQKVISDEETEETNDSEDSSNIDTDSPVFNVDSTAGNVPMPPMPPMPAGIMANSGVGNYSARRRPAQPLTGDVLQALLGQVLMVNKDPGEELISATVRRISVLDKNDPSTAIGLRKILLNWQGAAVNAFLLKDVKNGKADIEALVRLLSRRKELREKQSNDVYDIRSATPTALGFSACLIENDSEYEALLNSDNAEAKTAMLACARLIRARLPVGKVAANLKSADKLLATAAEKYLESEDSPEARAIVLSQHPNEAKILGATLYFSGGYEPGGYSASIRDLFASVESEQVSSPYFYWNGPSAEIRTTETRLRKELLANQNLLGIYAFDGNFIRIFNDKAVFSWEENKSRYRERVLEGSEFEYLKSYLASQNVSELPPFVGSCAYCQDKELLMLGRQGGRRIFLKAEETPEFFTGLDKILANFRQVPARLHYGLEEDLKGLEILYADNNIKAQTVWKNGADLRLLLNNETRRKEIINELEKQESREDDDETAENYEEAVQMRRRQRAKRLYESYSWQQLNKNQLAGIVSQPAQVEAIPANDNLPVMVSQKQWQRRAGVFEIRDDDKAIYKITRGQAVKISDGGYNSLVVTPDGRWLIATKYAEDAELLIRRNLLTNKEFVVDAPDKFPSLEPIDFIASQNKMLVFSGYGSYRDDIDTGRRGNYYLMDAASGALTPVKGEFGPLLQQSIRPLQPAANVGEFWAAIPDPAKNMTSVGLYNTKTFAFKPLLKIPKISFNSMMMWVDETEKKVYFVYEGQALSLPIKF